MQTPQAQLPGGAKIGKWNECSMRLDNNDRRSGADYFAINAWVASNKGAEAKIGEAA